MMNQINQLIWPNKGGIGMMDKASYKRTWTLMKRFGGIKKTPNRRCDAYRTDLAAAAVAGLKKQGMDVYGKQLQADDRPPHGRREVEEAGNGTEKGDPLMSLLIKGGRIVTAADDYVADVFVDGERISLIGSGLDVRADRTIDAAGKYVLPGCIDPHTHLDMPFGGTVTIDDFESGQTSAAFGGTTCHVDFCIQGAGPDVRRGARDLAREGERQDADRLRLPHRDHRPA